MNKFISSAQHQKPGSWNVEGILNYMTSWNFYKSDYTGSKRGARSRWIFDMVIVGELSYCYLAFSLTRFLSDSKLESNYQKIKRCSQLNRNSITWQLVNEQRKNGKSQKSVRFAQDEILMHFIITIWDRITASKWAWAGDTTRKDSKGFANTEIT